jgi:hypothetical protein
MVLHAALRDSFPLLYINGTCAPDSQICANRRAFAVVPVRELSLDPALAAGTERYTGGKVGHRALILKPGEPSIDLRDNPLSGSSHLFVQI